MVISSPISFHQKRVAVSSAREKRSPAVTSPNCQEKARPIRMAELFFPLSISLLGYNLHTMNCTYLKFTILEVGCEVSGGSSEKSSPGVPSGVIPSS